MANSSDFIDCDPFHVKALCATGIYRVVDSSSSSHVLLRRQQQPQQCVNSVGMWEADYLLGITADVLSSTILERVDRCCADTWFQRPTWKGITGLTPAIAKELEKVIAPWPNVKPGLLIQTTDIHVSYSIDRLVEFLRRRIISTSKKLAKATQWKKFKEYEQCLRMFADPDQLFLAYECSAASSYYPPQLIHWVCHNYHAYEDVNVLSVVDKGQVLGWCLVTTGTSHDVANLLYKFTLPGYSQLSDFLLLATAGYLQQYKYKRLNTGSMGYGTRHTGLAGFKKKYDFADAVYLPYCTLGNADGWRP